MMDNLFIDTPFQGKVKRSASPGAIMRHEAASQDQSSQV
jgi:hypothetical protein